MTYSVDKLCKLYIEVIVKLHGVPVSIVSDRDARFTSKFWSGFQKAMGTDLDMSTAFHPQTDGQTERVNQVLEDMLRACVLDFKGSWEDHLPLIEFSYNNNYHSRDLAYRLALPPSMSGVHNVFHVSMLRKYVQDVSHVIDYGPIEVHADTTFVVEPVRILDRSTKQLRRKEVDLVKVLWSHHDEGDASWELESDMRAKYPQLFVDEQA
ncbi:uncharacterized protein LOC133737489 [Rosa rugosa]|uniref:uncharacterized protein LOC133737489 n=1 Tax=Rosa rugosa TaxID=74645 RepID=UPI002B4117E2|nr:uncharacterized protein LOC133737489 [Rosa rugosa]